MKFRVSMKAVLWTWLLLILMLIGLGYNAYDKLRPEAFVQLATEQVQKNIPNSELIVGSVDYSFSIDFNIKLKQVTIIRNQVQIAKVGELELRIPWWLLVTHRGTAQVNIGQVEILLSSHDVKKMAKNEGETTEPHAIEFEIPNYLSEAQFTLRAKDLALKNEDASRTYLQISKLLVREFGLKKNSAFEIKLPVWFEHNNLTYNSEIWLFGDLTPDQDHWAFNYTGDFRTKDIEAKNSFDDVALEGSINLLLPQFAIEAQNSFMIDKEEKGTASFKLDQSQWKLDLDFTSFPLEFLGLFEKEILNDYLKKFEGDAQGKVTLSQKFDEEDLLLAGSLSFPGKFKNHELAHEGQWEIHFDNNLWTTRFTGEFIQYTKENLIAFQQGEFLEVRESYQLKELSLLEAFRLLPSLEKVGKSEVPLSKSFLLTDIKQEEQSFNGSFELSSNIAAFNYGGEVKSSHESLQFSLVQDVDYALDIKLGAFKSVKGLDFFSPWINGTGVLDFEFKGRELSQFPLGQWKLTGKIENEDLSGLLVSHLAEVWGNFDRKPQKQEMNIFVNAKKSQFKLIDYDQEPRTNLDISFNPNLAESSTATMTTAGKKGKKTVKKISLGFLQKDS